MNISKKILDLLGWRAKIEMELPAKCVMCIAPHTSNWDFVLGVLFKMAYNIKSNFFIKREWLKFPLGIIIKQFGGIGISRNRQMSTTDIMSLAFAKHSIIRIGITPEGTRSLNREWKKGFYFIALKAKVPIVLVAVDYQKKTVFIEKKFMPTGDFKNEIAQIKDYFKNVAAKFPEKFGI